MQGRNLSSMSKRMAKDTATTSKRLRSVIHESMDEFLCPITHALPLDPVLAEDGKVYERSALKKWLREQNRSPSTNLPMGKKLVPATQIKNMIERMVKSDAVPEDMSVEWKRRISEQQEVLQLQNAAEEGNVEAAGILGTWHLTGERGLEKDAAKAHTFFLQAASGGDARAMGEVAKMFESGTGTRRNATLAVRWSSAGAALGNTTSLRCLAKLYEKGAAGLPVDFKEALKLREKAYAQRSCNSKCLLKLGRMYANGHGTSVDMERAKKLMREAVACGKPDMAVREARDWLVGHGFAGA